MNPPYQLQTPPFVARPPPLIRQKTYSRILPSLHNEEFVQRLDTIFDLEPIVIPPLIHPDDIPPSEEEDSNSQFYPFIPRGNSNTTSSVDMPVLQLQKNTNNIDQKEK